MSHQLLKGNKVHHRTKFQVLITKTKLKMIKNDIFNQFLNLDQYFFINIIIKY